jgi:hypothetical protein
MRELSVRVHHCISQEYVAQGLSEPPAKKCTCRKFIEYKEADLLVKKGSARWVVTARQRGTRTVSCDMCDGNPEIKNCAQCGGDGVIVTPAVWDTYDDTQIVLVSHAAINPNEKKYRPALAMKTPRVATIESEHIERAYVDGNREAAARIEEYGRLIQEARMYPGPAKCAHRPEFKCDRCTVAPGEKVNAIQAEPENDRSKAQGRDYDYGRGIIYAPSPQDSANYRWPGVASQINFGMNMLKRSEY